MSKDYFSFYYYLTHFDTNHTQKFITTFDTDKVPDGIISSRVLYNSLGIKSKYEFSVYQNAFLEYFKLKLDQW